ncbi:MAG: RidA family protein [Gammaproteobacteria bacterium]|nr:RidA family protein [Gammaproteobacteria bacterium]MDH5239761.1 RidA family protein [Gammaproteobacteria bacterium]MDH5260563.1 RidA family protein [Gammaproteobacteria bacterium]MDH5582312.1 RidA family protein [Gammaproteobacteria bacterium]
MASKKIVRTGTKWEPLVGYCRAVRVGPHIAVSGSAPVSADGQLVGPDDAYLQARRCIEIIAAALEEAGASLNDVVRTRMFVTDISRWEEIAKAHQEAFATITPATSMVEVSRLIGEGMLVEIEADAIVDE